jgi:hypothetical protein
MRELGRDVGAGVGKTARDTAVTVACRVELAWRSSGVLRGGWGYNNEVLGLDVAVDA